MMRFSFPWAACAAALLFLSATAHAADPAATCESSQLKATSKYLSCVLGADSKAAKSGDASDYSKCSLDAVTKAEDKAGAGVCPSTSDLASLQAYLDQCAQGVSTALGGGDLPPDPAVCEAALTSCEADLGSSNGNLGTCNTNLTTCEGDLAACEASSGGGLPSTGQTTPYGTGSDGDLQRGEARSFVDNGDGTITDHATGLMWEKKSDDDSIHDKDNTYTWSAIETDMDGTITTFLADLNSGDGFAGYTDWRIPNRNELLSLTNTQTVSPATYAEFNDSCTGGCTVTTCSCTKEYGYWSSTTWQGSSSYAWYVYFYDGNTGAGYKPDSNSIRAVRAGS